MPSEAAAAAARANGAQASGGDSFSRGAASAGLIVGWELVARAHTPRTAPSVAPSVAPPAAPDAEGRRQRDLCELPSLPLLACALPLDSSPDGYGAGPDGLPRGLLGGCHLSARAKVGAAAEPEGQALRSAVPPAFGTAESDDVGA